MNHIVREGYQGTGPGAITPDGCAVELYRRLPVNDEPQWIARAVGDRPRGLRLLELGSGTGRLTRPLAELGLEVTAVDESSEMLAALREGLPGVRTVRSPIEELELGGNRGVELFDVVLLASFLVHAGPEGVREGLLRTCRRHVAEDGIVLIQREAAGRHENLPYERHLMGGGVVRIVSSESSRGIGRPGSRTVIAEYSYPDAKWTQTFQSCPLTEEEFEAALAGAGLTVDTYLDPDRSWVRAVRVGP
ncbi:class I SAM-dependent methyltransferase [Streptomyces sp. NBC_00237]|uniref:class I SAM-dependent methyltransferase n=1 Tax=Streptomyces sp. NBC_00237 TaxID=2975687 RepID=UPI00224CAC10|nr:methyltransferase [Streptomyces sp. NBC_00237]MCX5201002.1 class I SAM-dependent methyltransferase [Streptomyces sp. NBC_00237]